MNGFPNSRQRERHLRRFKSVAQAQPFLAVHDAFGNLFTFRPTHFAAPDQESGSGVTTRIRG
jgi:transposase-like protein